MKTSPIPCEVCGEYDEYESELDFARGFPPDIYRVADTRGTPTPPLPKAIQEGFRYGRVCGRCRRHHPNETRALGMSAEGDALV